MYESTSRKRTAPFLPPSNNNKNRMGKKKTKVQSRFFHGTGGGFNALSYTQLKLGRGWVAMNTDCMHTRGCGPTLPRRFERSVATRTRNPEKKKRKQNVLNFFFFFEVGFFFFKWYRFHEGLHHPSFLTRSGLLYHRKTLFRRRKKKKHLRPVHNNWSGIGYLFSLATLVCV